MTTQEILELFVSTDPFRNNLTSAWSVGGFIYGTNGRIAVRIPGEIELSEKEAAKTRPDCRKLFGDLESRFAPDNEWIPLSEIANPMVEVRCEDCQGTGQDLVDCQGCGGTGETECLSCGHDCECEDCDGTGKKRTSAEKCKACDGRKVVMGFADSVATPAGCYMGYLLDIVAKLPNARIQVPEVFVRQLIAVIAFDGGEALIMPFRDEELEKQSAALHAARQRGAA